MEKNENITIYDKQKIYREKIEPMVKDLLIECMKEKIPIAICSAIANTECETKYKTEFFGPGGADINLSKNRFGDFLLILQGTDKFRIVPAQMAENDSEIFQYIQDTGVFLEDDGTEVSEEFLSASLGDL